MNRFHCHGVWWLPGDPRDRVAGKLTYSDTDGISLELFGVFGEPAYKSSDKRIAIVLGLSWDCPYGSNITIRGCRLSGFHLGSPGIAREDYLCQNALVGEHFEREEDCLFNHATIEISGASSWADDLTGLESETIVVPEAERRGYSASWKPVQPLQGPVSGGKFLLGIGARASTSRRRATIEERVQIVVDLESPNTPETLLRRYAYPLQNLLTFATGHPNALLDFSLKAGKGAEPIRYVFGRTYAEDDGDIRPYKMLFALSDVKDRVISLVSRWIDLSHELEQSLSPFFAVQYKRDEFVDIRLLCVFQAIEGYARHRFPASHGLAADGHNDQTGLIRGLVEQHWKSIASLFNGDAAAAANEFILFRNYVVHRQSDLGRSTDYGTRLYWTTQKLTYLMYSCLLSELGFSEEVILRLFERNQQFAHIAKEARAS